MLSIRNHECHGRLQFTSNGINPELEITRLTLIRAEQSGPDYLWAVNESKSLVTRAYVDTACREAHHYSSRDTLVVPHRQQGQI